MTESLGQPTSQKKAVDTTLVDAAVKFVNEKANETLYKGSEEIGAYILEKFFDNDINKATSKNPRKPESYRALCAHPELVLKPEALSVMVRVAAQEKFFLDKKLDIQKLSYSQKAELVKLGNDKAKLKLVRNIIVNPVSVRKLQERINKMRKEGLPERNPSLAALESHIDDPVWLTADPARKSLLTDDVARRERLSKMSVTRRKTLLLRLEDVLAKTEEWIELYKAIKTDLEDISKEKAKPKSKK
jgi:hypothetical protein